MNSKTFRIATRQSPLALWQANHVREQLMKQWPNHRFELLPMVTSGDQFLKDKLLEAGGKGLFVKELEEALLDKRADIAVHSAKDMPANFPPGLHLAAICKRDNPFDALVNNQFASIDALPSQAIVGTSSLRRQAQLLAYRPDLQVKALRGNINTRLAKLDSGEYQAIVLAAAGLERMGLADRISQLISPEIMLPACGQGALSIECRTDDLESNAIIATLNDPLTALCVHTERNVNAQLGGNCHTPLAIYCSKDTNNRLVLQTKILNENGSQFIEDCQVGNMNQANQLADHSTQALYEKGAAELLEPTKS